MRRQFLIGFAIAAMFAGVASMGHAAEKGLASQVSNEREIKVTVTPGNITREVQTWDFEVTLETHTQTLNDDLAKSSMLIAGGKQYLPLSWEGAPPGGHHRKGKLRFKAIVPPPQSLELQIRLAADPAPRSFKWLLK